MTILEETIIFILSQIHKVDKRDLSKIELFKLIYLIETESYRFTGESFFDEKVIFTRDGNGPISVDIYKALDDLSDFVQMEKEKKPDYPHSRHSLYIKKGINYEFKKLKQDQKLFINSVLLSFGKLNIKKLKEKVYDTEPMVAIRSEEKRKKTECLKGARMDFETVKLDQDMRQLL